MRVLAAVDVRDAGVDSFVDDLVSWATRGDGVIVDLLYVTSGGPTWLGGALARAMGAGTAATNDAADARLLALRERLPAALRGDARRTAGNVVDVLEAASDSVDLIVLAARSHGAMHRAVIGSVAQAAIRRANCPVLVLPPGSPAPARPRLLFGVDLRTDAPAAALEGVGTWARALGGVVDLVHIDAYQAHFPYVLDADLRAECEAEWKVMRAADLASLHARLGSLPAGTAGDARIEDGDPAEELPRLAATADLLVVATHGRRGAQWPWLGSVAERLVQRCTTPMLILRAKEA